MASDHSRPETDGELFKAAQRVLEAAYDFREECGKRGLRGALRWITDTSGAMFVYTRGEYAHVLREALAKVPAQDGTITFEIAPESPEKETDDASHPDGGA